MRGGGGPVRAAGRPAGWRCGPRPGSPAGPGRAGSGWCGGPGSQFHYVLLATVYLQEGRTADPQVRHPPARRPPAHPLRPPRIPHSPQASATSLKHNEYRVRLCTSWLCSFSLYFCSLNSETHILLPGMRGISSVQFCQLCSYSPPL